MCTQKVSTLLKSVSVSGRPSVRLSDNAPRANPIVMKFFALNRLIDISVEFEDEHDWSTPSWFIAKNVIIPVGLFHGVSPKKKHKCLRIDRKISYLVELEKLCLW